jgi:TonB-linked SusC/RagA family outer membrane protein
MRSLDSSVATTLLALSVALLLPGQLRAQQAEPYTVQGTVYDATAQQPMANVAVTIAGTSLGTLSNPEGSYTIRASLAPGTYTLEFSFIGRRKETREIRLAADRTVSLDPVYLTETAIELSEIVVTLTGVEAERRTVGNSVESVSGAAVSEAAGAPAIDVALQGKVTGAWISENSGQPGGGVSVRLRGTSSILGGAEPLYVVDGVIVDNNTEGLVDLSSNVGRGGAALTNALADLAPEDIERIEVLKGPAAAALYGSRANNGVIQIFTKRGRQGRPRISLRTEMLISQPPDKYDLNMSPYAGTADVTWGPADSIGQPIDRYDIQDSILNTNLGYGTYLSITGGTEETSYFVSANLRKEGGIHEATEATRRSVRANISQRISDQLELSANASLTDSDQDVVPEGEQTQGTLTNLIFGGPTSWSPFFDPDAGRYPNSPILGPNPLDVINNWDASREVTRFAGSVQAVLRPIRNLTVRYLGGMDDYREENRYFEPPYSISPGFAGLVQNPVRISRQFNHDLVAEYVSTLSPSIGLSSTAGFRYTSDREEIIWASAEDLPPGQDLVSGATQFASQSISEYRTVGGFLQERLSLSDRLFVTAGLNLEASSAFGPDERWQWFPRFGASYLLHEEPFWQDSRISDVISTLRLRAAYGETGGQPPGVYTRFENYVDVAYAGKAGLIASTTAGNPNLKPERESEIEAGFDLGLFNDRAVAEFSAYFQKTKDLVLAVQLPPSRGVQSQLQNIGEVSNNGWEAALTTVNINRPGFTWRTRLSLAANNSKVEKLVTASDTLVSGYLNAVVEGQPVGVYYGWYYDRDEEGNIVIDTLTGLGRRARDTGGNPLKKIIGDPNPDLIASLTSSFDIGRNLQVSFLLDGRFGNDVANFTRRITEYFGTDKVIEQEIERQIEQKTNPDLDPLKYTLNGDRIANYEEYVEDGSFVKLREIAVSYRFDQPFVRRLGAESIDLRVAARNLMTWTDYSGLDPEVNMFSANTVARGVDFATTPVPRMYVISLTYNF